MALIMPGDFKTKYVGSYSRDGIYLAGKEYYDWVGYVRVTTSTSAALDVIIPSKQKGKPDTVGLVIPANSYITSIGIKPVGPLTLAAATGKLKLATALNASNTALYAETPAAAGGVLANPAAAAETRNLPSVLAGTAATTFRVFATDGGAGATAVASTVSAAKPTLVLVKIAFERFGPFPSESEVDFSTDGVVL